MHGILAQEAREAQEAQEVLALFDQWGQVDRSQPQTGLPWVLPGSGVGLTLNRATGVARG